MTIESLIPHRGCMRLIDEVLDHGEGWILGRVSLTAESTFATTQGVPAAVGLEYLAQCSAALFTLAAVPGDPPRAGMLVSCRSYGADVAWFDCPGMLDLRVEQTSTLPAAGAPGLVTFRGSITGTGADLEIARGEFSVVI